MRCACCPEQGGWQTCQARCSPMPEKRLRYIPSMPGHIYCERSAVPAFPIKAYKACDAIHLTEGFSAMRARLELREDLSMPMRLRYSAISAT